MSGGYMLCASPRSGSTLLCDMLSGTGVAGQPASYLRPLSIDGYAATWQVSGSRDGWDGRYLGALRRNSAAGTGCPALRIMWSDMPAVLDRLDTIAPHLDSDRDRLGALVGIEHFVQLRRDDVVAQAVSLVIAQQTGLWHRHSDGSVRQASADRGTAVYDHDAIVDVLQMLSVEAAGWEAWFRSQSISPLTVTYEDLAADPADVLRTVLDAIGRPSQGPLPVPGTARLATALNDEWVARFRDSTGQSENE